MRKTLYDKLIPYVFVTFIIWALVLGTFYVIGMFKTDQSKTIKFEVTGIVNNTNATTLVQMHFECIKYCTNYYGSSGYTIDCYDQCALLGKGE